MAQKYWDPATGVTLDWPASIQIVEIGHCIPLTVENVCEALQGLEGIHLSDLIPRDKYVEIGQLQDTSNKTLLQKVIECWLGGRGETVGSDPSWRKLIWTLDDGRQTRIADNIRHYAEHVLDPTLTVKNVTKVMGKVKNWYWVATGPRFGSLGLRVPLPVVWYIQRQPFSETRKSQSLGEYWVKTDPAASWDKLASVLNTMEEYTAAAAIVKQYLPKDPTLTTDNLMEVVKEVEYRWRDLRHRLVSTSKREEINRNYWTGTDRQKLKAVVDHYLRCDPTASWKDIAHILQWFELHKQADEVTTKYVKGNEKRSHLAACERAVKAKGSLDQTAIHCVFLGMPRSGKSSLMHRLLGKRLSLCASTGVAEKVVRVEIRKSAVHVSGLLWCELEDLDDEATLLMCDASKFANTGQSVSLTASLPVATQPGEPFSLSKFLRNLFKWTPRTQHEAASPDLPSPQLPEEQGTKHPLEVFGDAFLKKWSKLKDLVDDHWTVYLTDTGGQPEFQELLPILVCGPSVFFLVFRLDLDLNSRYQVEYINSSGESIVPYESGLTVQETLLQSLATIASTSITRMVGSKMVHIIPRAFFVGTHKDRVSDQHLHQIDNTLQAVVKRTEAYREGMVQFASESRLILPVNNLSEGEQDVQQIQAAVERIGKQGDYQVKTPFSWLMFSNVLQQTKPPVLEYEQCFKLAQKCEINTRGEMSDALQFLHENIGVIRYYHDVPDLRQFIIKDLRYLFDVVTDLLAATFTFDRTDPSLHELFKRKGIFPLDVFEKLAKSTEFLPPSQLVTLLQHLNIIALLRKDGGSCQYFIPCVLAHSESSQPTPSSTTVSHVRPLLVTFESGYCPKGLFGSMAVYLLENKMESGLEWGLEEDKIFRDQICLSVGPYDLFQLTVRPGFLSIELRAFSGASTRRISLASVCSEVRQCISSCIREVCDTLHCSRKAEHSFGFFCPEEVDANQSPHPATFMFLHGKPCILKCPISHKRFDLPDDCLVWFNEDTSTVDRTADTIAASGPHLSLDATTSGSATQSSTNVNSPSGSQVITDAVPTPPSPTTLQASKVDPLGDEDFLEITEYLIDMEKTDVYNLGLVLGLSQRKVVAKMDSKTFLDDVIMAWLRKEDEVIKRGEPSWSVLVSALKHRRVGQTGIAYNIAKDKGLLL